MRRTFISDPIPDNIFAFGNICGERLRILSRRVSQVLSVVVERLSETDTLRACSNNVTIRRPLRSPVVSANVVGMWICWR